MKKCTIALSLVALFAASALADNQGCMGIRTSNTNKYYGPTHCNSVTLTDLEVAGALWLDNHSKITGPLSTQGLAEISNSEVDGTVTVEGMLSITNGMLKNDVDQSGNINANSTSFKNITMEPEITGSTITLDGGSVVNGDITFKGLEGTVILKGGSAVTGIVTNGKVIKQ